MIFAEVQRLLAEHQRLALHEMAQALGVEREALRGMLERLERAGRVRRLPSGSPCAGGCSQCNPFQVELWTLAGEGAEVRAENLTAAAGRTEIRVPLPGH